MSGVYSVADVAFIGGSLVGCGGHNPLEPAQFGAPILMGHSYENFAGMVRALAHRDAIKIVRNQDELANGFKLMLEDREASHSMGERAREFFEAQHGATKRTVEATMRLMKL